MATPNEIQNRLDAEYQRQEELEGAAERHSETHYALQVKALERRVAKLEEQNLNEKINGLHQRVGRSEARVGLLEQTPHMATIRATFDWPIDKLPPKAEQPPAEPALMTHWTVIRLRDGAILEHDRLNNPREKLFRGLRTLTSDRGLAIEVCGTSAADAESSARELRDLILAWEKGKK